MPVQDTDMLMASSTTRAVPQHTMASAASIRSEQRRSFLECSTDPSSMCIVDEPTILRQFRLFLIGSYVLPICL